MAETAWLYAAVSSSPQEATLEDQRAWAYQAAAANGWIITRNFSGVSSGAKGTRDLLEGLLAALKATPKRQRPERILMIRLDRIGRGTGIESIRALADIRALGPRIFTREDGDVKLERASDTILPAIRSIVSALENEVRSDKWKAVHARRRAAGLHVGLLPFGCVLVDGRATPYEPEAAIVRRIFELAEQRWGYTRLARWARERAPFKQMADGSDKAYRWGASSVKSILNSKTIRGLVVTEEQWHRTRAARQVDFRARSPRRWPWPLQGAVRCTCGKLLSGHTSGETQHRIRYYVCRHHTLEPGQRSHPAHRAEKLEAQFVALLLSIRGDPKGTILLDDPEPTIARLKEAERQALRRIADAKRRSQKAWKLAEEARITASQLRDRLAAHEKQLQDEESKLREATTAISLAGDQRRVRQSLAEIFHWLPAAWATTERVELQQELAQSVAELPEIGGLWADPERRGELFHGLVAKQHKMDDSITKKFIQSITE